MADTVTTKTVFNGTRQVVMHFTNTSDGTGETAVKKVDISTLRLDGGAVPTHIIIDKIMYDVASMRVQLYWDHTSPETIAILQEWGTLDWKQSGGLHDANTGATGSIMLSTLNQSAGDGYDITLYMRII